jgi:putative hydrolase of the HAD superfamily
VLEAVLFDWGDTLMPYGLDDEFVLARTRAGLAALTHDALPDAETVNEWLLRRGPDVFANDRDDEVDYLAVLSSCFEELGCTLTDDDVRLYAAESIWESQMTLHPLAHALLDALRERGLRLALVSNMTLPSWLLGPVFERLELAERLDVIVLSSEVGKRKPHPLIFERALTQLGVPARSALFVGDRRYQDVRGAAQVGMKTVLAQWARADEHPDGWEPDFEAYTMMDVLNIARRLQSSG